MFDNMGFMEWGLILLFILILFGPEKLPKMAQTIGKTIREVKNALSGITDDIKGSITDPLKEKFKEATADPKSDTAAASYEHQPGTEPSSYEGSYGNYDEETGTYREDSSGYDANPDGNNHDSYNYDGYTSDYGSTDEPKDESKHFLKQGGDDDDRRSARRARRTRYRGKTGRA